MKRPIFFLFAIMITGCLIGFQSPGHTAGLDFAESSPFLHPDYSKKISMDFEEADISDVLKIFSQQTQYNLITSESIAGKKITVFLDQVPVEQALEQILEANNLTYELRPESNIFIVKSVTKPDVELITRVYPLKHASVFSSKVRKTLNISTDEAEVSAEEDKESTGIHAVIKGILTEKGKIFEDPRTNSLIITDIASNFVNIENAISRLDVPVPQILIEVEMLEVSKDLTDKMGIKFGEAPLTFNGGTRSVLYPWDQNKILQKGFAFDEEWTAGTLDATGLTMVLNFLKTDSNTKNLARPRILTMSNQTAQIKISTDEAIGAETTTTSSQNIANSSIEAERVETGVFLTVTPQINLLTREVTMAVVPKVIIARTGGTFAGQTFKDPEERGAQALFRVNDGETIIIGGLFRTDTTNTQTKVPILSDIPVLGAAFRHKNNNEKERELIIFITPHILPDNANPATQIAESKNLIREQDIPSKRLQAIESELRIHERENM